MIAVKSVARYVSLLMWSALCMLTGCAAPPFTKAFQPPKKAPTEFSCGENCPHAAKHSKRVGHSEHDGHQH